MTKACEIINGSLSNMLKDKELVPIKKLDDSLKMFKERAEEDGDDFIGTNIISAASTAIYLAFGRAINPQMPFEALFKTTTFNDYRFGHEKVPKLMFTILNGGKDLNSKIKFKKFYLIFDFDSEDVPSINIL